MERTLYWEVRVPKRGFGTRVIHVPCDKLKERQRIALKNEYRTGIGPGPYAHGFVRRRSIKSYASPHVGKKFVVEVDIKNFFHSVRVEHVVDAWIFEGLLLPQIMTRLKPIRDLDWKQVPPPIGLIDLAFIRGPDRRMFLPQGSPLSPYLANLAFKKIDFSIAKLLRRAFKAEERASYTRYADNLAFSADSKKIIPIARHAVKKILEEEGFLTNRKKFKVMSQTSRQKLCGVVVNRKLSIPKRKRHEIRGRVHNIVMDAKNRKAIDLKEFRKLDGFLSFASHIDPAWAKRWKDALHAARTMADAKV